MLYLGFANQYFTLWDITTRTEYGRGMVLNGVFTGETYRVTNYEYLQNLSFDLDAARVKIANRAGSEPWGEDMSLRGSKTWCHRELLTTNYPDHMLTFGQFMGSDIRTMGLTEDGKLADIPVWHLKRAVRQEFGQRRRAIARRRLVDLGVIVRFPHTDQVPTKWEEETGKPIEWAPSRTNWATPKQKEFLQARDRKAKMSGHFFANGQRVTLELAQVGAFSFDTVYGTTYVREYQTTDGKLVKYMGGNPIDLEEGEVVKVTATIKHDNYKGIAETKLLRIKKS